jgi:hypothetical protein
MATLRTSPKMEIPLGLVQDLIIFSHSYILSSLYACHRFDLIFMGVKQKSIRYSSNFCPYDYSFLQDDKIIFMNKNIFLVPNVQPKQITRRKQDLYQ